MKTVNDQVQWLWENITPGKYIRESKTVGALIQSSNNAPLQRARVCLHGNPSSNAQCMFIALSNKSYIPIHRHFSGNESYLLTSGEVKLIVFSDCLVVKDIKIVSCTGPDGINTSKVVGVEKGDFHTLISQTTNSTYIEFRDSPHCPNDQIINLSPDVSQMSALIELSSLSVGSSPNNTYFKYEIK